MLKSKPKIAPDKQIETFWTTKEELILAWTSILRPITEYAVPLWHSGLSEGDSFKIELLQKKALCIILGTLYIDNRRYYKFNGEHLSYHDALKKTQFDHPE